MQDAPANLLLRNDTILGVCEAIGQDFGFNPNYLRVALCVALFFSPVAVIATYFGAGLLVLASRLLFPTRRDEPAAEAEAAPQAANSDEDMPIAA